MASHPHHNHCHSNHLSNCSCCCSCNSSHPSEVSQSPTTDPPLQALAAQLLQSSQTHLYAQYPKPQQHQLYQKHLYQKQQHQQTQSLLSSLLRRIEVLESSFHQIPASHPPPPPPPPHPSNSLRDVAARIIQTHFRAFLVRRSRTLRQLKDLAFVKASLISLKSSISDGSQLKPEVLSQKAMDLLIKLDSIQGGDPMIRDGKKSVSRDLVRFLEFVDGVSAKRRELSSKATKSLRLAENSKKSRVCVSSHDPVMGTYRRDLSREQRELLEKLRSQARGISENNEGMHVELESFRQISYDEDDPKIITNHGEILLKQSALGSESKKNVSFAENGDLTRVFDESYSGGHEAGIDQGFLDDDQRELVENLCREVEEIGGFSGVAGDDEEEEAYIESKVFQQANDGDRNPRSIPQREANYGKRVQRHGQNGEISFSAPLPVQMDPIIREVKSAR
ncbi:BAG family molecular chaperone regulator 8, chloroplastic [Macadamia integrifolia]|uniref:BAG family molecular chaperone regulator 8, chloroplastic n=1 Tax=Macadamia integrifolia TaxID=60698 RepID=UPI001C4F8AFA|nr:BAG family molecular chaperone regulator 8, chloroplastic [Macadamia integrifolia]